MSIWIPGYERYTYPGLGGYPFDYYDNPKLCWHTTEGGSVGGALGAYAPYPPHAIVNPSTGEKLQHISLDLAAYSAMDQNDRHHIIQFEVVGFAGSSHTWPESTKQWLGENVVKPLRDLVGIPDNYLQFYGEGDGVVLASPYSPIRLSPNELRNYSGHLGHQHLPNPDEHWDPGRMDIQSILGYSGGSGGFLMSLSDDEQQEVLAGIRDMRADGAIPFKQIGVSSGNVIKYLYEAVADMRNDFAKAYIANGRSAGDVLATLDGRLSSLEGMIKSLGSVDPAPVPPDPPVGRRTHVVVKGDTLYKLATAYNTTVPRLQEWNGLGTSTVLSLGQSLFVTAL